MDALREIIINQAHLDWEGWSDADLAAKSRIRWKVLVTGERTESTGIVTGIAEIPPGEHLPCHHHDPAETYYIISGRGQMQIADRMTEVGPGCAIYIPPNVLHAFWCVGTEPLVFVFSCPRDRFDEIVYHFEQ